MCNFTLTGIHHIREMNILKNIAQYNIELSVSWFTNVLIINFFFFFLSITLLLHFWTVNLE